MNHSPRSRPARDPVGPLARLLPGTLLGLAALANPVWADASADDGAAVHLLPAQLITGQRDRPPSWERDAESAGHWTGGSVVIAPADPTRAAATWADTLRRVPGVMVQESFGGFEPPRLALRGSGVSSAPTSRGVALLIDGLPLARADGAFHAGLFDPLLLPGWEVYRGTLHPTFAPIALGGALNARSAPAGHQPKPTLQVTAGGHGTGRVQAATAGPATQAALSHQRSDGWRPQAAQARTAVWFATTQPLAPTTRLTLSTYAAHAAYEVPGPLTLSAARAQPRSVSAVVLRDAPRRESTLLRAAAALETDLTTGAFTAGVYALHGRDDFRQLQPNGIGVSHGTTGGGRAGWNFRGEIGSINHHLKLHLQAQTGREMIDRHLTETGRRGARFARYVGRADNVAFTIEEEVALASTVSIGAGLTGVRGRRTLAGRAPSPDLQHTHTYSGLNPRLGAAWTPRPGLRLHGALSRGLEPPTFDDLVAIQGAHPALRAVALPLSAQTAITGEVGLHLDRPRWTGSIVAYHGEWRREILRLADGNGLPRGAVNAGPTRHEGVETAWRGRLIDGEHRLTLELTSTLGRFRFDDDPVLGNRRLGGLPAHTGTAELLYEHPVGWFAALESTWVGGRTPADHANRLYYDGHVLGHLRAGWRVQAGLSLVVAVNNVADHRHIASTAGVVDLARTPENTSLFLPGQGRAFTVRLTWHPGSPPPTVPRRK